MGETSTTSDMAVGAWLYDIGEADTELAAVAKELLKARLVAGGGNDTYVPDARQQKHGQRVVDHGLVVDGHQLFADTTCDGGKACA